MMNYIYYTCSLSRFSHWQHFAEESGMYIDSRGILFMWAAIPDKYRILIETI